MLMACGLYCCSIVEGFPRVAHPLRKTVQIIVHSHLPLNELQWKGYMHAYT